MENLTCPIHPKYGVIRPPRAHCDRCWVMWLIKRVGELEDEVRAAHSTANSALYVANR